MTLERIVAYGLAFVLLLLALRRRSASVRARDISGIVVAGSNSGAIVQNKTEAASRSGAEDERAPSGDRVAWAIGVAATLIAAAQLAFDVLKEWHSAS
jgi:hypothetical protein